MNVRVGGLCVLWAASRIIPGIFEVALGCLEDLLLSILARKPHKELCPREPTRPKKKDEGHKSIRSETLEWRQTFETQDGRLVSRHEDVGPEQS